ncbi:MAG: trigger factor [Candidatus Pelagibacterales bacterium]
MNYKETINKGLKRGYEVTIKSEEFNNGVNQKTEEIRKTIKVDGFRPGKVPASIVNQKHGDSIKAEVLNKLINDNVFNIVQEKKFRPIAQPKVDLKEKKNESEDTIFTFEVELFPEIELVNFEKLNIDTYKVKIKDKEIDQRVELIAKNQKSFKDQPDEYKAKKGDSVRLDYEGTIDGKNFDGGKAEEQTIVIGSGQYLKDLEDGLIGLRAGDTKKIPVKFPDNYQAEDLKGASATFECKIKKIGSPEETKIDDAFAKSVGTENLKDLKTKVKDQMQKEYDDLTKNISKKNLFDILEKEHEFEMPVGLIETEFNNLKQGHLTSQNPVSDDHNKEIKDQKLSSGSEKKFKDEAKKRIQLGLVLQEVGRLNNIQVTQDEMNKALYEYAMNFKGQEQKVIEYYKNNQDAMTQLQAPIYESKILDFILEKVKLKSTDIDVDSFIKIYNGGDTEKSSSDKKKTVKKKTVKKTTIKKKAAKK